MGREDILFLSICALIILGGISGIAVFVSRTWVVWRVGISVLVIFILLSLLFLMMLEALVLGAYVLYESYNTDVSVLGDGDDILFLLFILAELLIITMILLTWRHAHWRYRAIQSGLLAPSKLSTDMKFILGGVVLMGVSSFFRGATFTWSQWIG